MLFEALRAGVIGIFPHHLGRLGGYSALYNGYQFQRPTNLYRGFGER